MRLAGKVVVVTGAARGIGAALVRRFAEEGAAGIVVSDLDLPAARAVVEDIERAGVRGLAVSTDVTDEGDVRALVEVAERVLGPVDLFCANAGGAVEGGLDTPDEAWEALWRLNVASHVYAARAVLPRMRERGSGYLLTTCSAAGMLANRSAPYAVTKAAAVSFTEWLAIEYGGAGVTVSALCPKGVLTTMLQQGLDRGSPAALGVLAGGDVITPEAVADAVVAGLDAERFLILPHPEVAAALVDKATDRDAFLAGLRANWQRAATPSTS